MNGLSTCFRDGFIGAYCPIKLTEFILATLIAIFALAEILLNYFRIQGTLTINFPIAIETFLFFSLVCTACHQVWTQIQPLGYIGFFFSIMNFITIFYYVGSNVARTFKAKICTHTIYLILVSAALLLTIYCCIISKTQSSQSNQCTQIYYLCIDSVTFCLSCVLFGIFLKQHRSESQKQDLYSSRVMNSESNVSQTNSPFRRMWILISANIMASLINLVETLVIIVSFSSSCHFSNNPNVQAPINFMFQFFSYYLCSFITLLIFHLYRVSYLRSISNPQDSLYHNEDASYTHSNGPNKLQLIPHDTLSSKSSHIS